MMYPKTYTVYIIRCADASYYTGLTSNIEQRYYQHVSGQFTSSYTRDKGPLTLVYTAEFTDVHEAIAWERRLKRWSRKKKIALIEQKQELLIQSSKRKKRVTDIQSITYYVRYEVKKMGVYSS